MSTIARFKCISVEDLGWSKKVKLQVMYAPDANGEDANFTKATPCGEIWMQIDNPSAATQFVPDGVYSVLFDQIGSVDRMTGQTKLFDKPVD